VVGVSRPMSKTKIKVGNDGDKGEKPRMETA
jgi:hypothetical protein